MAIFHSAVAFTFSLNPIAISSRNPYLSPSKPFASLRQLKFSSCDILSSKSHVISDSLRLLEWDTVCDLVSSFAGTQIGRERVKAQLWSTTELSYEESKMRLIETSAAIEIINYDFGAVDFSGIDVLLVQSAINQASKGFPITGLEALAVVCLVEFAKNLQTLVKEAVKKNADWYNLIAPLAEVIMDISICHSLVSSVKKLIDEDGSVRTSASSELKRHRAQVFMLERKLHQLMEMLVRDNRNEASSLEIRDVDGRWCIKSESHKLENVDGLLLSSSGSGNLIEPIVAIQLNDELQQARALAAKAEEDVLMQLTDKILAEIHSMQNLVDTMIRLDIVAARAKYSLEYGATYPNIYLPDEISKSPTIEGDYHLNGATCKTSFSHSQREWKLYMRKAHHPLLLSQYRKKLQDTRKAFSNTSLISPTNRCPPVPVDFVISAKATVVVITGPNTGGKTVSLKTVGLASLMSKAGLYVLASEPVKLPWFDAVYVDIGDEQSLTQSLSTFSAHLKQISMIRSFSTSNSLVLLDEVGAGTNPIEGAALGMSLLESFAKSGSFLTIVTTHLGELKTLKYSNHAFENACVEFDEESLQPTYKILWGIPGRSNAINIAKRLGLSSAILSTAHKLHGKSSAKINEAIMDMETSKQNFEHHLNEAQHYLMLSKKLYQDISTARQRIATHRTTQITNMAKSLSDFAATARSILHTKYQQSRKIAVSQITYQHADSKSCGGWKQSHEPMASSKSSEQMHVEKASHDNKQSRIPKVGETVIVTSLGKEAKVLEVLLSKGEILLQASNIKLRLKLKDISISS